ncbi:MAG: isochorismatase family protein [Gammaproteobacteria bacterium]|nr:isochorismatase family protein [Gammaproteobacteria bacterium]
MSKQTEQTVYERQGFGQGLELTPPAGLLIVDFINGFADPDVFGGGNIRPAVEKTRKLLSLARERGWLVSYTRVVYSEDGSDANVFTDKVPGCLEFTETSALSQVVPDLPPAPGDLVIRKQFPSAFFGTHLASSLAMHGVKTLFISGATTSGCVRASAVDAMCHGFKPVIVEDCVGDRSIAQHEANLFDMKMKYTQNMQLDEVEALTSL